MGRGLFSIIRVKSFWPSKMTFLLKSDKKFPKCVEGGGGVGGYWFFNNYYFLIITCSKHYMKLIQLLELINFVTEK